MVRHLKQSLYRQWKLTCEECLALQTYLCWDFDLPQLCRCGGRYAIAGLQEVVPPKKADILQDARELEIVCESN